MMFIALLSLLIWVYLVLLHGRFWSSTPELPPATPGELPDVDIVIPARDEAETIGPVIASLLAQDYKGRLRIFLVDDNSTDGTATKAGTAPNLMVITGQPKPEGWSGKLWAVSQGTAASNAPVLLFADADIVHDPRHVSALVNKLHQPVDMVSEMVRLNCVSLAERALVPAFVYFFQMLYPFARVNDPRSTVAAAAGGTVLIRRTALERIGGIAAIKSALIDDCALAAAMKRNGPIYLSLTNDAESLRIYGDWSEVWNMVARSAYTQLNYSPLLLLGTVLGLCITFLAPPLLFLFGHGTASLFGLLAWIIMALCYSPMLRFYNRPLWWAPLLPVVALVYLAATLDSALRHMRGKGGAWKGRYQAVR